MPLPKKVQLNTIGRVNKPDVIKQITAELEKAKLKLAAAQETKNEAQIKKLQQIIADLTGTIARNS